MDHMKIKHFNGAKQVIINFKRENKTIITELITLKLKVFLSINTKNTDNSINNIKYICTIYRTQMSTPPYEKRKNVKFL